MEFFLKNLNEFCYFISNRTEKCLYYIYQIQDQIYFSKLILLNNYLLVLSFFFILFSTYLFLKKKNYKIEFFYTLFFFLLILLTILIFKNNLPFTDSWYELDDLVNNSQKNYLFKSFDYTLFGFRPIHLLIYNYFYLNYHLITYLNVFIYSLSVFILFLWVDKYNAKKFLLLFLLIVFSGKWFNIFYEPVNIVWTINFLLTLCFCYLLFFKKNLIIYLCLFFVLFFSIINFKASFVTIIFSIFYGLIVEKKTLDKLFFILCPIFLLLLINYFIEINSAKIFDINSINIINNIPTFNIFEILKSFISMQSIIFFPYTKYSINISFIFSLFQNSLIVFYLFKKYNLFSNLINFAKNNPLMIIGILGCFLTSLKTNDIVQIRYFSFSLIYQTGFLFFVINNFNFLNNLKKYLFIRNFLLISFFLNLVFFHQGIHFAISKSTVYNKSLTCLKKNQVIEDCKHYIYDKTFYGDKNFDAKKFNRLLFFLKINKLSIFREL